MEYATPAILLTAHNAIRPPPTLVLFVQLAILFKTMLVSTLVCALRLVPSVPSTSTANNAFLATPSAQLTQPNALFVLPPAVLLAPPVIPPPA